MQNSTEILLLLRVELSVGYQMSLQIEKPVFDVVDVAEQRYSRKRSNVVG